MRMSAVVAAALAVLADVNGAAPDARARYRADDDQHQRAACSRPSRLKQVSPAVGLAARAGPISFVPGALSRRAVVRLIPNYPGEVYPHKVLIYVPTPLATPVTLKGRRCSDGKPLRFWYRAGVGDLPGAGSATELRQTGDLVAELQAGEPPITHPALGYPGYILFSSSGKWKVFVRQNGRLVGTVVFRVVAP